MMIGTEAQSSGNRNALRFHDAPPTRLTGSSARRWLCQRVLASRGALVREHEIDLMGLKQREQIAERP